MQNRLLCVTTALVSLVAVPAFADFVVLKSDSALFGIGALLYGQLNLLDGLVYTSFMLIGALGVLMAKYQLERSQRFRFIDRRELQETQERLLASNAQLEERNSDLDAYAHTVAHDLKGPISVISGYSHLLSKSIGDEMRDEERDYLTSTIEGCDKMAEIIDDRGLEKRITWEGVTCDYCHSLKTVEITESGPRVEVEIGDVKRGPIRDAESTGHEVAYSELHSRSEVCAPCHEYVNREGVAILSTFSEWHESAAAERGDTCQTCHMALTHADVVDLVVAFVEHARGVHPPLDVATAVDPRRPDVLADRQRHGAPRAMELLADLGAGRRGADDENAALVEGACDGFGHGQNPFGLGRMQVGLVFTGIDDEQQRTFLYPGAGRKVHALQKPGDPGADFNFFKRHGVARKRQVVGHLLLMRLADGDLRRRRLDIGVLFFAAADSKSN